MANFEDIIKTAVTEAISDVYVTANHPVVFRRRGKIEFTNYKYTHTELQGLTESLLDYNQLSNLQTNKSVDIAVSISGVRLRINVFYTLRGLSLAIRLLPGRIPTIEDLNLHPSLHEIARLANGLVLCCGATGVGKSTTIASIIDEINKTRQLHIITLEDPIEYRFQSIKSFIQQRELGTHMTSFAQGLRDTLRENPDVTVVGELRDAEVIKLTINAAEAGHLVIATLHASTPEEAIYRLCNSVSVDAQDEIRTQLSATLRWLIVQQLEYIDRIGFRVPILSILRDTPSVRNVIRENKLQQLQSLMSLGKSEGMFTFERYKNEFIFTRSRFTRPENIFKPTVIDKSPELTAVATTEPKASAPPTTPSLNTKLAPKFALSSDNVLELDGHTESLHEIISKIHQNQSQFDQKG